MIRSSPNRWVFWQTTSSLLHVRLKTNNKNVFLWSVWKYSTDPQSVCTRFLLVCVQWCERTVQGPKKENEGKRSKLVNHPKTNKKKGIQGRSDQFVYNTSFQDKRRKITIPLVKMMMRTEGQRANEIPRRVEEQRKFMTEAAIVRVMKARKQLKHNSLIAEVSKQLRSRFEPSVKSVKLRIESLIDREYLERVQQGNDRAYKYLA